MIKEIDVACHLSGSNFSPNKLEQMTGIELVRKTEVGDIFKLGINRGNVSTYGYGVLYPPKEESQAEDFGLDWVANVLNQQIDTFQKCGLEDIDLVIGVFYVGQCNFTLDPKALKKIGSLNIPLQISCYETDSTGEQ
ncbi:hypothetical protein [Priestia abyssalis]|uniref:hypothetical protein n=1 Tax=Priestia abyssalis TaxID=1221450 RepID=UPI000995C0B6|nr:hypothetical protein [Priestia abyssalis]